MGKPALVLETTLGRLDPVAAELILLAASGQGHDWTIVTGQMIVIVWAEIVVFVGDTLGAALAQTLLRTPLEDVLIGDGITHGWYKLIDSCRHRELHGLCGGAGREARRFCCHSSSH